MKDRVFPATDTREMLIGSNYTDEEREFLAAIQAYRQRKHRSFLSMVEVLEVAKQMGYRKVSEQPSGS